MFAALMISFVVADLPSFHRISGRFFSTSNCRVRPIPRRRYSTLSTVSGIMELPARGLSGNPAESRRRELVGAGGGTFRESSANSATGALGAIVVGGMGDVGESAGSVVLAGGSGVELGEAAILALSLSSAGTGLSAPMDRIFAEIVMWSCLGRHPEPARPVKRGGG